MDRILLGNTATSGADSKSGFWVSKPGVNVIAYASNGYYAGTEPGIDGYQEDGSILPIYGFNQTFNFTGSNTFTYGWVDKNPSSAGSPKGDTSHVFTTSNNTIRFVSNVSDPWFINVLNTNPYWTTTGFYRDYWRDDKELSFNGNNYPLFEIRLRRPPKSDGTHWTTDDILAATSDLLVFFNTSNASHSYASGSGLSGTRSFRPSLGWSTILGTSGEWTTIEFNLETNQFRYERAGTISPDYTLSGSGAEHWACNTMIDALRFDFSSHRHTSPDADLEVDYIRAKKRGIPINFGDSYDDNFLFSTDWEETGLVHRTGRVVLGNEYAWANGYSKESGTSHPGSTSGRIEFPKLPYIPVVLFQRYDPSQGTKMSFPGGDKEFSFAHCDVSSNTQVWNPLTKQYQPSTNTAYGSEYRTFAYARAGYDHFDLTCRNAIARDGFEHLFNYTPQEPYVEIYKGGNYDPESENPESFVMYPKQSQNSHITDNNTRKSPPTRKVDTTQTIFGHSYLVTREFLDRTLDVLAIDNGVYSSYDYRSDLTSSPSIGVLAMDVKGLSETGSHRQPIVDQPPATHPHKLPPFVHQDDITSRRFAGLQTPIFTITNSFDDGTDIVVARSVHGGASSLVNESPYEQNTGDMGVSGSSFAVGKMNPNTLGIRRGQIITKDSIPKEGFDSANGAGGYFQNHDWNNSYLRRAQVSSGQKIKMKLMGDPYNNYVYTSGTYVGIPRSMELPIFYNPNGGATLGDSELTFTAPDGTVKNLEANPVNGAIYQTGYPIGSDQYSSASEQLDWSARDHMDGRLGYFANYTGMDKGNCLPTFDWANKFGDWNVPQFNNFYQYDADIGAGSYVSFKDAIGTSWNANNTKFLDDSMWLGYANNRFEYKGDIWHPQAPTKTYDELSGMFGYGGTIAHQGDWHDHAGTRRGWEHGVNTQLPNSRYGEEEYLGQHGFVGTHPFATQEAGGMGPVDYTGIPGHGYLGVHVVSRYDSNAEFASSWHDKKAGPFAIDVHFRNRYMYRPFNGTHPFNTATREHYYGATSDSERDTLYSETLAADYQPELGGSGPGTQVTYGRLHDYGRTGTYSFTNITYGSTYAQDWAGYNLDIFPNRWNSHDATPPNIFWADLSTERLNNFNTPFVSSDDISPTAHVSDMWTLGPGSEMREAAGDRRFNGRGFENRSRQDVHYISDIERAAHNRRYRPPRASATRSATRHDYLGTSSGVSGQQHGMSQFSENGSLPSWTEPQTGYYGHKDSFVVSRWYTYPGATFAYDISNFSGPAHYDAWYKNDVLKETNDYKRKDYPQLYSGGWGNYGYFPTQQQLDEGKGATRLFPIASKGFSGPTNPKETSDGSHGYGSVRPDWDWNTNDVIGSSEIEGPFVIFKKRAFLKHTPNAGNPSGTTYDHYSGQASVPIATERQPIYLYFVPNHLHSEKQISRTFGIPNDIAGDYYVASTVHNERGANPQVHTFAAGKDPNDHKDPFHDAMTGFKNGSTIHSSYGYKWHTKNWNPNFGLNYNHANLQENEKEYYRQGSGYYHPVFNPSLKAIPNSLEEQLGLGMNRTTYPDYRLKEYLFSNGIDITKLKPGDPIPIKADPYFAGMAFEGTNAITGAFTAHRFEFIIKKTKSHINHFRQSYEYNLPGRNGHRADTLRPIGYGLATNMTGFDTNFGPPPMAHAYFDSRQLGGGSPFYQDIAESGANFAINVTNYTTAFVGTAFEPYQGLETVSGTLYRTHNDGRIFDVSHPAFANTHFPNGGWGSSISEVMYDVDLTLDPVQFEKSVSTFHYYYKQNPYREIINLETVFQDSADNWAATTSAGGDEAAGTSQDYVHIIGAQFSKAALGVSISRHGRDVITNGIIGAVEVSNTYFADYRATYWDETAGQLKYWITGSTTPPPAPTDNNYYNLQRPIRYRPAKSQGASPETQMYGAYLGAPWNRHVDYHPAWAGPNRHFISSGNHWEADVLPGMCKADNALTNWGTVDLSKFDHESYGYRWHTDAWYENDKSGLAASIMWAPSKTKTKWSEANSISEKGRGTDPSGSGKSRRTQNQKGGTYDGFKLHERPEFQPVSGDGRYFGGVGGVDNWGGTSYNTWGPGMSVSPTVWDLKWTSIQHPFGVSPSESEDANTFYGATSIENQTSLIGGAPNARVLIGDNGGTFKYSDGTSVAGTGYDEANTWSATDMNYDWAIGGHQIQSNHWDRTLKIKDLQYLDRATEKTVQHANNGIQYPVSLKVRALYGQSVDDDGDGDNDAGHYWFLENNGNIKTRDDLGWIENDEIVLLNGSFETQSVRITGYTTGDGSNPGHFVDGTRVYYNADPNRTSIFGEVGVRTTQLLTLGGSSAGTVEGTSPATIDNFPQLIAYNKTLAENPSRQPAGAFKANTTYHFQYMYDESKINPPEYVYWVLRIPASMDSYNGESLI